MKEVCGGAVDYSYDWVMEVWGVAFSAALNPNGSFLFVDVEFAGVDGDNGIWWDMGESWADF